MFEKITVKTIMVAEFEVFGEDTVRFEKFVEGGAVRVFLNGEEVNYFTNYEIKDNHDRFEAACVEWLTEYYEEWA